ncbi:MAG: hypothetical protein F6K41_11200 [Symploca sp. SIO3E6]|nr:hypothetical protein [Caldora sp. SIO3E6]
MKKLTTQAFFPWSLLPSLRQRLCRTALCLLPSYLVCYNSGKFNLTRYKRIL